MANDYGPNNVYSNIPPLDNRGENQIAKFNYWNPDPIGTSQARLAQVHPDMQAIVNKVRADNPNLNFVVGSGLRSAQDQANAYKWGWSTVAPNANRPDVNQKGLAVDLWPLDQNGKPTFDPGQLGQVGDAMKSAASQLGTPITWGGDWNTFKDRSHFQLDNPSPGYTPGKPLAPGPQPNVNGATAPAPAPGTPAMSGGGAYNAPPIPAQPVGTTINSTAAQPPGSVFNTLRDNIGQFESGGNYHILGPVLRNGDQAIGKYQVMASNVPSWTQKWLGQSMTPAEFRANPQAQEAVFNGEFGSYLQSNSPADAASMWFTGKPLGQGANLKDVLGTSGAKYAAIATKGLDNPNAVPSQASGPIDPSIIARGGMSPPIPDGSTPAPATAAATPGVLPGFTTKAASDDFTKGATALDKAIHGDQSAGQQDGAGQAAAFNFPQARNVHPLLGLSSQIYGNTLNSLATPLQWGSATPGQNPYAASGGAPIGQQFGTQLTSIDQMRQMMAMMGSPYASPTGT